MLIFYLVYVQIFLEVLAALHSCQHCLLNLHEPFRHFTETWDLVFSQSSVVVEQLASQLFCSLGGQCERLLGCFRLLICLHCGLQIDLDRHCNCMKFRQYLQRISKIASLPKINTEVAGCVLGNSSADYDSILGSLIYAFYLSSVGNQLFLPMVDCPAQDLSLRFQVSHIMKNMQIGPKNLLFWEEHRNSLPTNLRYYLYDHNHRKDMSPTQIIDHHDYSQLQCSSTLIYPVGSAMTLLYFLLNPQLLHKEQHQPLKQHFDKFLLNIQHNSVENYGWEVDEIIYYGIIMDCFNFDPVQKDRWTVYDRAAKEHIESKIKPAITYEQLSALKFSEELNLELTLSQLLRRDYKYFHYRPDLKVEYSVMTLNPKLFTKHYEQFKQHIVANQIYFLMFIWQETVPERALIFTGKPEVAKDLEAIRSLLNQMEMKQLPSGVEGWDLWQDPSRTISRKVLDKKMRQLFADSDL